MTGENRNFKCQKCSNKRVYRTKLGLDRHQKIFCSERVGIKCSICSKAFKTRSGRYKHYKKCHQNLVQASQELFKKTCDSTKSNDDSKIEVSGAHSQDLATHGEDPIIYIPVNIQTGNSSKKWKCKMLRNTPMRRMIRKVIRKSRSKSFTMKSLRCLKNLVHSLVS